MLSSSFPLTEPNTAYLKLLPFEKLSNCIADLELLVTALIPFSLYHSMPGPDKGNSSISTCSSVDFLLRGVCMVSAITSSPVCDLGLKISF